MEQEVVAFTSVTGRGGYQLLYRVQPNVMLGNTSGRLAPAVDTRGEGGQIVFPGSIHPDNGRRYQWYEGWAMAVGVAQRTAGRGPVQPEVPELAHGRGQAAADLAETVGPADLAEEHGHELIPAGEALGSLLGVLTVDGLAEIAAGNERKNLCKKTGDPYHMGVSWMGFLGFYQSPFYPIQEHL